MLRVRADRVATREVEGQVVGVDLGRGEYFALTAAGTFLWPALVEGTTREDLVALLQRRYRLDGGTAASDVDTFLDGLAGWDLLEP